MSSNEYGKLIRSWNSAVKLIWNLPHNAHTYFIEQLTECPHLQSMLHSRYIGFTSSLHHSKKIHVKALFSACKNDLRTVTGQNLNYLMEKYNAPTIQDLFDMKFDISHKAVYPIDDNEKWRINFLEDLVCMRANTDADLTTDEIEDLIYIITTS